MTDQERSEHKCVNTIRGLAMDGVQAANSGHPGTPMAMAPVAYELWNYVLRFDPEHPIWPNRDRFVLSMGHASMLLYSMLHLAQVKAVNSPNFITPFWQQFRTLSSPVNLFIEHVRAFVASLAKGNEKPTSKFRR